ncbi:MAG: FecR family protein [Balneolaceae bacterium]
MNKENYTISELVNEASFRRFAKGLGTSEDIESWDKWIKKSDQNRLKAKAAIAEISGFEFVEPAVPNLEKKWSELHKSTIGKQPIRFSGNRVSSNDNKLKWFFRISAILVVVSLLGLGLFHFNEGDVNVTNLEQVIQMKTISTDEGERKTISFSNGSKIVLNSNSSVTYSLGLIHNQTIEVILEGEAWFEVNNSSLQKEPVFAVSTPDGIIRDIGTKFLVTVEKDWSRVILQEGIVEIEPSNAQKFNSPAEKEKFEVKIGEMVQFNNSSILSRKKVNTTFYTSWATGFMKFENKNLREFANHVEELFNAEVEISDPDLAAVTLEGAVYFRSLEELIRSISEVTSIPVYQSEDRKTVYIGNPNESN